MPDDRARRGYAVSDALLPHLLADVTDAVVVASADKVIQMVNPSFERIFGYTDQDVVGSKTDLIEVRDGASSVYRRRDGSTFAGRSQRIPVDRVSGGGAWDLLMISEVDRWNVDTLLENRDRLRLLHQILTTEDLWSVEGIRRVLQLTCEHLGLDIGIVSRVEGDVYRVDECHAPGTDLRPGDSFPLGETYCSITLALGESVLAIDHVGASAHRRHPCYEQFRLESYIGCALRVGGRVLGTLNFSSADVRPEPFDAADHEFVELLARWLERALAAREERARIEERLRHVSRLEVMGRLAGGVAHDFNNILTVILGHTRLARLSENGSVPGHLQEIAHAAEHAGDLTRQLLKFSRQKHREPTALSLDRLVQEVVRMLDRVIGEDIELIVDTQASGGFVRMDKTEMIQILMNLLVNARDAMPQGGTIRIETGLEPARAAINGTAPDGPPRTFLAVSDTGVGMDEETTDRALERFFTTKGSGGTGLGLAMVHEIVRRSGGSIEIDSTPGCGTTVAIRLPAEPGVADGDPLAGDVDGTTYRRARILVIGDRPTARALVSHILSLHGHEVVEASSAEEALLLAEAHGDALDLVLIDIAMTGLDGQALVRRLSELGPEVPVVYMSGAPEAWEDLPDPRTNPQEPLGSTELIDAVTRALNREHHAS